MRENNILYLQKYYCRNTIRVYINTCQSEPLSGVSRRTTRSTIRSHPRLTTTSILVWKYLTKCDIHSSKHRAIGRLHLKIHACQSEPPSGVSYIVLFPVLLCSIWYSVFNNELPVEHRGSSFII